MHKITKICRWKMQNRYRFKEILSWSQKRHIIQKQNFQLPLFHNFTGSSRYCTDVETKIWDLWSRLEIQWNFFFKSCFHSFFDFGRVFFAEKRSFWKNWKICKKWRNTSMFKMWSKIAKYTANNTVSSIWENF